MSNINENKIAEKEIAVVKPIDDMPVLGSKQDCFVSESGHRYICQFPGRRAYLELIDRCKEDDGHTSSVKLHESILKHVVVDPKVTLEYFDNDEYMDDYDDLIKFAGKVLRGIFPNKRKK